ncbi:hypothetical protein KRZ98_17020 [Sphingobium sp. AS12]|uniref:hypothetical protein n=1 Tax=Sphingobium sp. AS12 TaxID=2849495 RepID=UPI001C31C63C|nr:hypothetical protein [Sphingobium sp. AS12]MBV2149947.1 hypothetical protein [Sphingobium sp. AS12]
MDIRAMLAGWAESALARAQTAELATATDLAGEALAILNGFRFTAEQVDDAHILLGIVREEFERNPLLEVAFLAEYAADERLEPIEHAAAALHARAGALAAWSAQHDRPERYHVRAIFDAAARCELIETSGRLVFNHDRFTGLIPIPDDDDD